MAENFQASVEVPIGISVFGSLVTEMAPSDLPEGVSPDNQDIAYLPGSVFTRPGLRKLYSQLPNGVSITYFKTFVPPNGHPINLVLDSAGNLYKEDIDTLPGVLILLDNVAPGSYASSTTAFGKEYIVFHDCVRGTDVPLQFDGQYLDRITQDGPTAPPVITDLISTQNLGLTSITVIVIASAIDLSESNNVVTVDCHTPHGLGPGKSILIYASGVAGYDGIWQVQTILTANKLTYVANTTGMAPVVGTGNITLAQAQVTCPANHNLVIGDYVTIVNAVGGAAAFPYDNSKNGNPDAWLVSTIVSPTVFTFSLVGMPAAIVALMPTNAVTNNGTLTLGGKISAGVHQFVVMYLTRQGFITAPSVPSFWICGGNKKATVTGLPIGPNNVIARVLAFTGAGGGKYFTLLKSVVIPNPLGQATIIAATVITDNVSTTATINFSDNALFDGKAIDIAGSDLFNQVILGPCIGVKNYASRNFYWGFYNKIDNFLNLSFDGGYVGALSSPNGWIHSSNVNGVLLQTDRGFSWVMTGPNPGSLFQSAYQDYYGVAIAQPSTQYSVLIRIKTQMALQPGQVIISLQSNTLGFFSNATFNLTDASTSGKFLLAEMSLVTPANIPSDLTLVLATAGMAANQVIEVDEIEIIPTANPSVNEFLISYAENPEALDAISGVLGPTEDQTPLQATFTYKDVLHVLTSRGLHQTRDISGAEPADWPIQEISNKCGAASPLACDIGENFAIWCSTPSIYPPSGRGAYVYTGGSVYKVSQEIQPNFDQINQEAQQTIFVKNDPVLRRTYFGIPTNQNTAPNQVLVLDYRDLDTASDLVNRPPVHVSFTGKLICSDLSRKWTKWNISSNYGEILKTNSNGVQMCFGGGNGQAPGLSDSFGNIYWLDDTLISDDDYGAISSYYVTYFYLNHEMEMALQVGLHRKLFKRWAASISGVGKTLIVPYCNTLTNPRAALLALDLPASSNNDIGGGVNVSTERCAFKIGSSPLAGQISSSFFLNKFIVTVTQEPVSPIRYGAV